MNTTIIHFIGIVLFWTQPTNVAGVQAIIPRIVASGTNINASTQHRSPYRLVGVPIIGGPAVASPIGGGPSVETHTAFIAFPTNSVLSRTGWNPAPLPAALSSGLSYVLLQNDHVRFDTVPSLNSAITPAVASSLQLPSVKNSCTSTKLRPDFQPPAYHGAAGVIDIPEGTLQGCNAQVNDPSGGSLIINRGDMLWTLKDQGAVVIRTLDGSKILVLAGGTMIYVANVPVGWTATLTSSHMGLPHYLEYYEMTDATNPTQCGPPSGAFPTTSCTPQPLFFLTATGNTHIASKTESKLSGGNQTMSNNSECSNSQFP